MTLGDILRRIREDKQLSLQSVSASSGIDLTVLSKIENGKRIISDSHLMKLAYVYDFKNIDDLFIQGKSDEIVGKLNSLDTQAALQILQVVKEKIQLGVNYKPQIITQSLAKPIGIESRRYIGSKAKLTEWIIDTIISTTVGSGIFFDVFGGTGVVAKNALSKFDKVIINDILYSNNIIYKAFFSPGIVDEVKLSNLIFEYNNIDPLIIQENYFSKNFGGKYFDHNVSKLIGYIRQDIEEKKNDLTEKEFCVLIASLIYSIDKLANTVGHFEAYIKKPIKYKPLDLRIIDFSSSNKVEIFKDDANTLASKIKADIAYIDPPYNSRQYSRFYHVYETLAKWDMPKLYGVALKPEPENMSQYCTSKAAKAFEELISSLNVRYIVVSYNNTYNSKSTSSENKISLEQIKMILNRRGTTQIYESSHRYFNTGKTEFKDHKELLFITAVNDK